MHIPTDTALVAKTPRKLGFRPCTDAHRKKAIPLRNFLRLDTRPVPPTDDYATKAGAALTKMMGNDVEGCCVATTIAKEFAVEHAYGAVRMPLVATDAEVSRWYHAVGGPGDNGLYIPEALEYTRDKGMTIGRANYKIDGFAALDNSDGPLLDAAMHWFGGVHIGVALTRRQYERAEDTDVWDLDGTGVVGGHSVPVTMRGPDLFRLATWGRQPQVTRRCLMSRSWCDECYVSFGAEWFSGSGLDTNGVNVAALREALMAVHQGGTPDIPPDPNPPTPPAPPVPVPPEWDWVWDHTFDSLGYALKVHVALDLAKTMRRATALDWWKLGADVARLVRALVQRDMTGILAAALAILADLGVTVSTDTLKRLALGIQTEWETRPLLDKGPPAAQNGVDTHPRPTVD